MEIEATDPRTGDVVVDARKVTAAAAAARERRRQQLWVRC